jgi:aldose 1-epimerase
MEITSSKFGILPDGSDVYLITLKNDNGISVSITTYGAIITSVMAPGKNGKTENIVCGFDQLDNYLDEKYLASYPYFGALCGRVANRIGKGKFTLEGVDYQMAVNNGPNHLHGGLTGFDRRNWKHEILKSENKTGVLLSYTSPDGEENYPGNLEVTCLYSLSNDNELTIDYHATTDKTTIVNLTNHSYFNLTGGKENIMGHELLIPATTMTELDDMIPTGNIIPVNDTPFDFGKFKKIGRDIGQLETGYDLNYVLDNETGRLMFAGCLREEKSGRQVEVYTTQPGIQLYTGYWIPELEVDGKKSFGSYSGVALETQHYPDSINHPNFPSVVLHPGEAYHEQTVYKFMLLE